MVNRIAMKDGRNIVSMSPIEGVPQVTGKGSAQRSIVSLGEGIDEDRTINMGAVLAYVHDPVGIGQPSIRYARNPSTKKRKSKSKQSSHTISRIR
jgi:hypothetical protein